MVGQRPDGSGPPGTIEFEITDFADARMALDDLPPGVKEVGTLAPGYWERRRRKPLPSDRALTGEAMDWLVRLPPQVRPQVMCEQFPRVANTIAAVWADPAAGTRLLERLLVDERGGRRGFPVEVEREIRTLAEHRRHAAL